MTALLGRSWRAIVGPLEIADLDVQFSLTRNLKSEANTGSISVWNLSGDNRKRLQELASSGVPVQLWAGYEDPGASMIFSGVLYHVDTRRDGPDLVTTIETGDQNRAGRKVVSFSLVKGSTPEQAIRKLAKALGVSTGNLDDIVAGKVFPSGKKLGSTGFFGAAADEMTRLCRSVGLEWSIQDGALQLLPFDRPLTGQAVVLSSATGLVQAPTLDNEGKLTAQSLIIPGIAPGRVIKLDAEFVKGNFRIESVTYVGETAGSAWYCNIEGKPY